jgi:ABC-type branched-subunit amino acid transport system substrate-binding protein/heme/copper-type cytochrome/quinol oxidase subunit 2
MLMTVLKIISVLSATFVSASTNFAPPSHFNLAALSPILEKNGDISNDGIVIQHAILMALHQLNDKSDGIEDNLLASTTLKVSLQSSKPYFEEGVRVAQQQIDAFNGEQVMGCIGPYEYEVIYGASRVFEVNHVAVMGYHDRHAALGLSDIFSNTLRTVPGDYIDGRMTADLVELLHWERVGIFSTSDTNGNLAQFFFEQEAKLKRIEILSNIHVSPNTEDFSEYLREARHSGAKIFVLLMPGKAAGRLMQQGYEMGVFNSKTQLIGSQSASDIEGWKAVDPVLPSVVSGFIGLKYHEMPETSDKKTAFIEQFRSQQSTLDDGGACNNATDDTGHYIYQIDHDNDNATPYVCTGLNFSSFAEDGSDIPPAAYHAYDAVYAMAHALHSLSYIHEVEFIDDEVMREELLHFVSFDGATGTVMFSSEFIDDGFDVGTRNTGMSFDILNYDKSFQVEAFKEVGTLSPDHGMRLCEGCSIVFTGSSRTKPLDRPHPHAEHISNAMLSVIIIVSSISLLAVIAAALMFYVYRSTRLIKASQPEVGYVILSGCAMGSIRSLTAIAKPSSALCMSQMWMGHLAFTIVFCALLVKTWKVHKVMNQTMTPPSRSSPHQLFLFVCICCACALWALSEKAVFASTKTNTRSSTKNTATSSTTTRWRACTSSSCWP